MKITKTAATDITPPVSRYLAPAEVVEIVPGLTVDNLAQMRHRGTGPIFLKPSPRTVVYREDHIHEWLASTAMIRTDLAA